MQTNITKLANQKKSFKGILSLFKKRQRSTNSYKPSQNKELSIADISAINLINKVDDVCFEHIISSDTTKAGIVNYIVFAGFYKELGSQAKLIYVLINEKIAYQDFKRLMTQIEQFKKGYLYVEIHKTTQASITSAKTQYKDKNLIQQHRVDKSQWQLHFNGILEKAIRLNSSDIHITAKGQTATVQARVHGDLVEIDRYTYSDMLRLISSAYNQLASIDSKDQSYSPNLTHETGIHKVINDRAYNLRFISKPIYPAGSFDVTMRLIDEDFYKPLEELGYSHNQVKILQQAIAQPNGLIVFAGRVGSGKSLTIHSICGDYIAKATHNNSITKKLVTFESPVEYKIYGAKQIEYKRDSSLSQEQQRLYFESQVQSLLRMDSNACVLGEIRGRNVAQLAIQLVQSDNIVLTTVHAQSALKIFNRLNNLGMDKEVLTEPNFFLALVYQTLVKVPCAHCAHTIDDQEYTALKERINKLIDIYVLDHALLRNIKIINPQGCSECSFGVTGRTLIAEIVEPNIAILAALQNSDFNQAYALWRQDGGITYQEHALLKILQGQICPVGYEDKVQPLVVDSFYADIDKEHLAHVFNKVEWENVNAS
ncbi:GspE/PulE family protein [Francisella sp. TX07-6608]|uniref:GspE/PulE family protein n=1 Tax=Francisella sp. TX07-6608 TaxID=573568 RepID=UPI0008F99E37|nr:ATPase, T2SS/T4P/T4SS family [Francisella sp. TX07-6608]OIN82941.1 type II/IV secretion system family protein [Francisella sp. TX07-6608]